MRHKKRSSESRSGTNLGSIITPMLDMSFQILAFFIMTYHPAALEGHVDGKLLPPKGEPIVLDGRGDGLDLDAIKDVLTVRVKAVFDREGSRREGQPSRFEILRPEDKTPWKELGGVPVQLEDGLQALHAELQRIQKAGQFDGRTIRLDAEPTVRHEWVMRVFDLCKQAGFKDVSLVAPVAGR